MTEKYQAPIVRKAFQILSRIAGSREGLTISELSKQLGISKSTVHGVAAALEAEGAVVRDPSSKRFTPGLTLFELGRKAYTRVDLKDVARPFMETLMNRTQESVFLGVRNGSHVTVVDIVPSMSDLKITAPVGTTIPLLTGATGKVFLSVMPPDQARALLQAKGLVAYTKKSITEAEAFLQAVEQARGDGFAVDDEEYIPGVRAIAAPVHGGGERFTAAIWVVGFKPSLNRKKMETLADATREAGMAISRRIEELRRSMHGIDA